MLDEEEQPSCCFSAVTIAAHEVLDVLARYNSSCNKNVRMSLSDITPSNSLLGLVTTSLCICVTKNDIIMTAVKLISWQSTRMRTKTSNISHIKRGTIKCEKSFTSMQSSHYKKK